MKVEIIGEFTDDEIRRLKIMSGLALGLMAIKSIIDEDQ